MMRIRPVSHCPEIKDTCPDARFVVFGGDVVFPFESWMGAAEWVQDVGGFGAYDRVIAEAVEHDWCGRDADLAATDDWSRFAESEQRLRQRVSSRLAESSPKITVSVEQARRAVSEFGGGFIDSCGRACGEHHPTRVIDAAERSGDAVTLETVRWKLRVGIA